MQANTDGQSTVGAGRLVHFHNRRIHLVGIGGAGMSGAASLLVSCGARVTGSDLAPFPGMGSLVQRGVRINVGHSAALLDHDVEQVVFSAAVPGDNPELLTARQRGLPVICYAELLGDLSRAFDTIAIAGTHGKSTTTALAAHILREAGLDPSYLVGARSVQLNGNSNAGTGRHFVVESCEFNRSFLHLQPKSAAVLNVEADHLDCYKAFDGVAAAFRSFASLLPSDGVLICNGDDLWTQSLNGEVRARLETFGFGASCDWRATGLTSDRGRFEFQVIHNGEEVLSTRLTIPGRYNVSNALAAIALAYHAGAAPDSIARGVSTYAGVERRLSWRGEARGITILDDYAHHPTEIRATLQAVRERYAPKRMWVVFQPHQYARTCAFMEGFAASFDDADEVIINDIYGARESDPACCRAGAQELADRVRNNGRSAAYLPTFDGITEHLLQRFDEGDVVLTMGAGDVWKVADELVARICGSNDARRAVGA